jgi:hypothetical protein
MTGKNRLREKNHITMRRLSVKSESMPQRNPQMNPRKKKPQMKLELGRLKKRNNI